MARYILKRLLRSVVTLLIVFTVVFMLLRFMPLNGYFPQEMIKETDEATRMTYLRNLGLLDHPLVQLWRFIRGLFQGDLGRSITVYPKVPISTLLAEKIPVTAFLGFWSMLLGIVAGISMGMMMVRRKNRLGDGIGNTYILLVRAVPSLIYLFSCRSGYPGGSICRWCMTRIFRSHGFFPSSACRFPASRGTRCGSGGSWWTRRTRTTSGLRRSRAFQGRRCSVNTFSGSRSFPSRRTFRLTC